jgi:hypothetical protein
MNIPGEHIESIYQFVKETSEEQYNLLVEQEDYENLSTEDIYNISYSTVIEIDDMNYLVHIDVKIANYSHIFTYSTSVITEDEKANIQLNFYDKSMLS